MGLFGKHGWIIGLLRRLDNSFPQVFVFNVELSWILQHSSWLALTVYSSVVSYYPVIVRHCLIVQESYKMDFRSIVELISRVLLYLYPWSWSHIQRKHISSMCLLNQFEHCARAMTKEGSSYFRGKLWTSISALAVVSLRALAARCIIYLCVATCFVSYYPR